MIIVNENICITLLEKLAELEHEQWMAWAKAIMETDTISEARRQRWTKYMVPYEELPEEAKEKGREWARKILKLLEDEGVSIMGKEQFIEALQRAREVLELFDKRRSMWIHAPKLSDDIPSGFVMRDKLKDALEAIDKVIEGSRNCL